MPLAALALLPLMPEPLGSKFHVELGAKVLIMAVFALSLQLLVGFTGCEPGPRGLLRLRGLRGGDAGAAVGAGNGWLMLFASVGASALLALVIGALVMRTKGIYFIMVTLAFAQLVYFVFHDTDAFGGSDGTYVYFKPDFSLFGLRAGRPGADLAVLLVHAGDARAHGGRPRAAAALAAGACLRRHQAQRAAHAGDGYATTLYKLASFVIGGAFAGLAGFMSAIQHGYVNPEILSWHQSGNALLMVILGGLGSLAGAVLGAFSFVLLAEWFQGLTKHWQLLMGGFIILLVAVLPQGIAGGFASLRRRFSARPKAAEPEACRPRRGRAVALKPQEASMTTLLSAQSLTRRFGALKAVENVTLDLAQDEIHAVIGTNGAGKSTLINLLSGELPASSGSVSLRGDDITAWAQPRRAKAGLGRSYQRNNIFLPLSVRENCRLAAQTHAQHRGRYGNRRSVAP